MRLSGGQYCSWQEIAAHHGIDASNVRRDLQLAFLALDIVQVI
ncbi:MAG: hypothetical protein WDZ84_04270 [Rhodovibrionaceae bacterium]